MRFHLSLGATNFTNKVGMANFDFLMAKQKHLSWKFRLRDFLDGRESLTLEQAVSYRDCDLGKWLYSVGFEKYKTYPEMQELEKVHMTLHETIRHIVELKHRGEDIKANDAFQTIEPISDKIIKLLDTISMKS
jgi:methyl-accepting chemotaxis protein